jgi:hypothetical protein
LKIKILDNFLNSQDLEELNNLIIPSVKDTDIKIHHNNISNDKIISTSCLNVDFLKRLHKNYHQTALNILEELNSEKKNLYDYSDFHIIETGKKFKFPIHDDVPEKILSGVIYLKPEKNLGTVFYSNKKGDNRKEIKWKINRAVFFSRTENETWHSYEGDKISNRIALVYNLKTKRIKDVYKIEKKNYFLGQFRNKINPYLHKFLKVTI